MKCWKIRQQIFGEQNKSAQEMASSTGGFIINGEIIVNFPAITTQLQGCVCYECCLFKL